MKKIISFGKIDYDGIGREINEVTIEIELRENDDKKVLSVCGNIWNNRKTDIICGGQCLDEIYKYLKHNKLFIEIYRLWKIYHLNDMHAGTEEQEKIIEEWEAQGNKYNYTDVCELLKSKNMYTDNGYRYGSGWLYREIPVEDLQKIINIING